ncbi:MAG: CHAT domain-containing protein, partial [Kofleriaceae bacterium]
AAQALLRRAIETAKQVPASVMRAHKAAAWSYSVLVVAAAQRGDGDMALRLLAEEQALPLPTRCVLGLAIEDQHRAVLARGPTGRTLAYADDGRTTPAIDAAHLVPADITSALVACSVVDVIARAPIHGMSRVLPEAIAWRYLSRRVRPIVATDGPSLVIADVDPPSALELPHLAAWSATGERLTGSSATPARVLTAIASAGEVVVHAHGIVNVAQPDASFIALSPDAAGRFALTTGDVRQAVFATSPLVILAACQASRAAPVWHETWSLPAAFVYAGARAVVASSAPIPDSEAAEFFDLIRTSIRTGLPVANAVRDARQQWISRGRGAWVQDVIVFE